MFRAGVIRTKTFAMIAVGIGTVATVAVAVLAGVIVSQADTDDINTIVNQLSLPSDATYIESNYLVSGEFSDGEDNYPYGIVAQFRVSDNEWYEKMYDFSSENGFYVATDYMMHCIDGVFTVTDSVGGNPTQHHQCIIDDQEYPEMSDHYWHLPEQNKVPPRWDEISGMLTIAKNNNNLSGGNGVIEFTVTEHGSGDGTYVKTYSGRIFYDENKYVRGAHMTLNEEYHDVSWSSTSGTANGQGTAEWSITFNSFVIPPDKPSPSNCLCNCPACA